jgi:hypothetical protein
VHVPDGTLDVAISTGAIHCFDKLEEIKQFLQALIRMTQPGGIHVISSFNDGPQDFSGHQAGFAPILPPHSLILDAYGDHRVLFCRDEVQDDEHEGFGIPHHHSITRLLARIER